MSPILHTLHSGPEHAYIMYEITEKNTFANILPDKFIIYAMQWFLLVCIRELLWRQLTLLKEFAEYSQTTIPVHQ